MITRIILIICIIISLNIQSLHACTAFYASQDGTILEKAACKRGVVMSEISVTILGTTAGVPTRERAHPTLYVRYSGADEHCFLFDCGKSG